MAAMLAVSAGCGGDGDSAGPTTTSESPAVVPFVLSSPAPGFGDPVPARFTCDGQDVSPPLDWASPPEGTTSLAILMDDLDADGGSFTHWTGWDIDAGATSLAEGDTAPAQGTTDFGTTGYGGPCPPPGEDHRYELTLYALREPLGLVEGADREEFDAALDGKLVAETTLVGTYTRD